MVSLLSLCPDQAVAVLNYRGSWGCCQRESGGREVQFYLQKEAEQHPGWNALLSVLWTANKPVVNICLALLKLLAIPKPWVCLLPSRESLLRMLAGKIPHLSIFSDLQFQTCNWRIRNVVSLECKEIHIFLTIKHRYHQLSTNTCTTGVRHTKFLDKAVKWGE